jgi:TetR/AcrR family transcriptional regulator, transcriptional repressor for nem operon
VRRLGDETRERYARGLEDNLRYYTDLVAGPGDWRAAARAKAIALFTEMIGSILLSRAVANIAPELSDEILESARKHLRATAKAGRQGAAKAR